jgi:hypothetical protein
LSQRKVVRLELPAELDARHSEFLQRDIQLLAEIANRRPESLAYLHNAAVRNDFGEAQRIAGEIGLSEERFASEGAAFGTWLPGSSPWSRLSCSPASRARHRRPRRRRTRRRSPPRSLDAGTPGRAPG